MSADNKLFYNYPIQNDALYNSYPNQGKDGLGFDAEILTHGTFPMGIKHNY